MITQSSAPKVSPKHVEEFERTGFLILDNFHDIQPVSELITEIESLNVDTEASRLRRGTAFAQRNLLQFEFVRSLISQPHVHELVNAISPGLIAVRGILFDKNGAANWTVPWHQDRSIAVTERIDTPGFGPWSTKAGVVHVQPPVEILKEMLTLRFHLDPCGNENGPLRVISATHHRILDPNEIEVATTPRAQTTCCTSAGGLLIMRPLLLHASSPATRPSHRRVIHVEFGPAALPSELHWAIA